MKHEAPIFDVTVDDFEAKVLDASRAHPVLVDFWADWCSPCLALAPVLHKVIEEYGGNVLLGKVDADENMKLAGRYGLRGFPTVILFRDGEEVARFTGAKPAHFVREFIEQNAALSPS
jgi:putative thioredoxin